ncbi:spore germination protein [Lysinibacillus fusiformis]
MHEMPEQLVAKLKKEINDVDDVKLNMIATEEGDVTLIYFSSLIEKMTLQTMVSIPLTNNIKQIHQMAQYVDPKDIQGVIKKLNSGQTLLFFHETNALLSMDTYSAPTRYHYKY